MSAPRPSRTESPGFNATTLLNLWVVALILIPATLVVKPLGAAGSPAQILGLFAGAWWLGAQLGRVGPRPAVRRSFVLLAMLLFCAVILVSYIVATTRPISELELSSADRGLMEVVSWLGVFLLVCTEVTSRAALDRTLRLLVLLVGVAATLGIFQFMTGISVIDSITIPGLSSNQALTSIYDRNGFARSAGTSTHPIEFGVLMAMTLPLALHYAVTPSGRSAFLRWYPVAAIAVAIPVSISRSALIGVIVVLAIVLPSWPPRRRRFTYLSIVLVLGGVYVAVPGLLGTLVGLFTGIGSDDSAASRTNSYDLAGSFISRAPALGRGFSTFLTQYRILDNQYLGLLIETGVIGLLVFLGLLVTGAFEASRVAVGAPEAATRSLGRALMASIVAGACAYATFDALAFNQVASLTFLMLGSVGLLTRLLPPRDEFLAAGGGRRRPGASPVPSTISADGYLDRRRRRGVRVRPSGGRA